MLGHVLTVLVGLVLLTFGADRFVGATARVGRRVGLPPLVVGLVLIGMGTSLPEMLVSGISAARPSGLDLALGNVIGSNIANLSLVLGLAALIHPIATPSRTIRREGLAAAAGSTVLAALAWNGVLSRLEGVLLLLLAIPAFWLLLSSSDPEQLEEEIVDEELDESPMGRVVVVGLIALAATLWGAELLVDGAQGLALELGVSDALIGLTVVAVGTSLPEMATALAATRRRDSDLVLGNVLGSNMFNALLVGGVAGTVGGGPLAFDIRGELALMVAVSLVAGVLALVGTPRIYRWEGAILLAGFPLVVFFGL